MDLIKSELEKRLKRKRTEVATLRMEIEDFQSEIEDRKYRISILQLGIDELQSLYNLIPSEADTGGQLPFRQNSDGWLVYQILRADGKPLYIDEILEKLRRDIDSETRGSLAGQLGGYVRKGQVFTRPAPNTFGLREWDIKSSNSERKALPLPTEDDEALPMN